MEVITKLELQLRAEEILQRIKKGAIFIHPSDTIYGLSCNALNSQAVDKIRKLKERSDVPLSVWVPSQEWIKNNTCLEKKDFSHLEKLPGQYTFIVKLKNKEAVAKNINPKNDGTLGVRIPNHWFHRLVEELNFPLVTTSANKSGQPFMTCLGNLDPEIEKGVDFIIYEGEKEAHPSQIVDLVKGIIKER